MRAIALLVAAATLAAVPVRASTHWIRTKDHLETYFSGHLPVTVTIQPGWWETIPNPDPDNHTPTQIYHPPITRQQEVYYSLQLAGAAVLRVGEIEEMHVEANHSYPDTHIRVRVVRDQTVWDYRGEEQQRLPINLSPMDPGAPVSGGFKFTPVKRHAIVPPNVLGTVHVGTGGEADPMVLEFDDPSLADDGGAQTRYTVEVKRVRALWVDKTIASGEIAATPDAHQRLKLEKGGPLHVAQDEWLRKGYRYTVSVRVKKISSDYLPKASAETRVEFKFQPGTPTFSRDVSREIRFEKVD